MTSIGARRAGGRHVVMLLENNGYPRDVRPRREAESLVAAGYQVTIIAPRESGEPAREDVGGVRVWRFRLPQATAGAGAIVVEYLVANLQLMTRALVMLARGADVLHLHNPPDTLFPLGWLARVLGRRVVFDLHDLAPELFIEKFGDGPVVRVLLALERRSLRVADRVLTVNQSLKDLAVQRGGIDPDRIAVLRNVPRRAAIAPDMPPRPGRLDEPELVFLGSMESQDGVDELPRLLELLRDRCGLPRARMTVIGDGSRRAAVEAGIRAAGLSHRVRFLGFVPHDRVAGLLAGADICVEPAARGPLNDRCSMVKVAEYMAAARPVVCFPLPEVRRMAGDAVLYAESGELEEMADQIAQLAADGHLRTRLATAGRSRALELTWERSEAALLDTYAQLLGERR
jgi:glycosyltransferase involved in cell wall biosynthesis